MTTTHKITSEKILNAISNKIRMDIIKKLSRADGYSFTELMTELNMSPRTDAGKFGYHLKTLVDSQLIIAKPKNGKYVLTTIGKIMAELLWELEEISRKKERKILVRTSNLTIEAFERRKIEEALMREAKVPKKIAESIATEAEERILQSNINYLTAPLIREFVNAILLEHGLEDYRHAMTRLGVPVYDVHKIIEDKKRVTPIMPNEIYAEAGNAVISEYTLIKELPRKVSDAHMAGIININNIGDWALKPATIHHKIRDVLLDGFRLDRNGLLFSSVGPPNNLKEAFNMVIRFVHLIQSNIAIGQVIDNINVILAPFIVNMKYEEIKRGIRQGLTLLNQTPNYRGGLLPVAFSFEINEGMESNEERLLFKAFMEVMSEGDYVGRPFLTPLPIIKLSSKVIQSNYEEVYSLCKLLSKWTTPYIINLDWKDNNRASYCWDLSRLVYKREEEINRMGTLNTDLINLPRIALESNGNDSKLFSKLDEVIALCEIALEKKREIMKKRLEDNLLYLLSTKIKDTEYYNLDEATENIGYVGLPEATKIHTGKNIFEDKDSLKFAEKIIKFMYKRTEENDRIGITSISAENPGRRLFKTDVARFGLRTIQEKVNDKIYQYTASNNIPYKANISLTTRINIESRFQKLTLGGHGMNIFLKEPTPEPEYFMKVLKEMLDNRMLGAFTFSKDLTYCKRCGGLFDGLYDRCIKCGRSLGNIINYIKMVNVYKPTRVFKIQRKKYII